MNPDLATLYFYALVAAILTIAVVVSLIVRWRQERARTAYRPLPFATRIRWQPDAETPIGDQLLREYNGGRR